MFSPTGNYEDPDRSDIRVEMMKQSKVYYNNVEWRHGFTAMLFICLI